MGDYDAAKANSEAQKRGALAALAQGGSQGLAAYNSAISQANTGRQQALSAATQRSALIGGPEANVSNYSAPINAAADETVGELATNRGANSTYFSQLSSANGDYFNKVNSALPIEELAQLRALANKSTGKTSKETILNSAVAQGARQTRANTNQVSSINKELAKPANALHPLASAGTLLGNTSSAQLVNKDKKTKKKVKTLQSQKKGIVTDPFKLTQQAAIAQGIDPDEASVVLGPTSTGSNGKAQKIVKSSPQYKSLRKEYLNALTSGVGLTQAQLKEAIAEDAKSHPQAAQYIYSELSKYAKPNPKKKK